MTVSTTLRKFAMPIVGAALTLFAQHAPAQEQDWPKRPVTMIVGFSPGGTTDIIARMLGVELSKVWGQPVIVENRPRAAGNTAVAVVAKAPPDGYTLFMGSTGPLAVNTSLYKRMPFDHMKDFTPISLV